MKKTIVPVALEGVPFIGFAAFLTLLAAVLQYQIVVGVGVFLTGFCLYFFRDPERVSPIDEDAFVSPADGKVIILEKIYDDRFVQDHVYKVSIFMNVFNVHVKSITCAGTVKNIIYSPGKFYSADSDKGALENEACTLIVETSKAQTYGMTQVAGLIARRIVCWAEQNDRFRTGERFGLIRFGSRVDLYLPLKTNMEIVVGQKVKAGETILGYVN
jgi:phosphatidylserine decarboxylase